MVLEETELELSEGFMWTFAGSFSDDEEEEVFLELDGLKIRGSKDFGPDLITVRFQGEGVSVILENSYSSNIIHASSHTMTAN